MNDEPSEPSKNHEGSATHKFKITQSLTHPPAPTLKNFSLAKGWPTRHLTRTVRVSPLL
jgi:hypothetical protein